MNATSILVVEDEALIADDLERTLKRLGYAVPAVIADGERAVEAAAAHAPSLVLMDIKLRGRVDGVDAARAIRERCESPVVFLTSYSDTATLSRASAARPYGYVLKPFAERDLRVAIELALRKHEVETALRSLELRVARSEHLASLGTMAAGICHEINNPLSCVVAGVGYGLEALDDPALRGEVRDSLRDAQEAAGRIAEIVKEFRTFARPCDERREETDLRALLDAALRLTGHTLRLRARLDRRYGPAPRVSADASRLTQVFVNLLLNAAQAIPPGAADRHAVEVSLARDEAGHAVVEVRDDGEGIAPDALPRVFDPFFTTRAPGEGMGLGLSICSRIVEAHGGSIAVQSARGAGATFRVRLPPAPGEARAERAPERPTAPPKTRRRVLVVDDEDAVARAVARILSTQHDVETCRDGRAALARLLGSERWDAVLCDLMMPAVSGREVYEAVLAARPALGPRFAFLTGGATTAEAEAFLARAGRPVLLKPLSGVAELRDAVNALIADADGH